MIQETVASDGELYSQGGKELSPKERSEREKNQKMLFKLKNGLRELPGERMDVSPADLERHCGFGIAYQIEITENGVYEDMGK